MEGQIMNDIGLGIDPISLFEKDCIEETQKQSEDNLFRELSHKWLNHSWKNKYTYHFSWLGRPIIQMPQDIIKYHIKSVNSYQSISSSLSLNVSLMSQGTVN